jgi:hypothetical protein
MPTDQLNEAGIAAAATEMAKVIAKRHNELNWKNWLNEARYEEARASITAYLASTGGETRDPADLLRFAVRKIGSHSHHCSWLSYVGYRNDPLDQVLVDGLLKGVACSLKELAMRPERTRAMVEGWRTIESAPKGYPSLEEPSEWFIATGTQKGPLGAPFAVIRRCFGHGFGPWEGTGDEYYRDDFFTHWMPLPAPPFTEGEKP